MPRELFSLPFFFALFFRRERRDNEANIAPWRPSSLTPTGPRGGRRAQGGAGGGSREGGGGGWSNLRLISYSSSAETLFFLLLCPEVGVLHNNSTSVRAGAVAPPPPSIIHRLHSLDAGVLIELAIIPSPNYSIVSSGVSVCK